MTVLGQIAGTTVRTAGPVDNAGLLRLMAEVHTPGRPAIAQERSPDFFALLRLHGGTSETYVAEDRDGRLVACGSLVGRGGFLAGRRQRVGHVCDLRAFPSHRDARILPTLGRLALEHARDVRGIEVCSAVSLARNRGVRSLVSASGPRRAGQPPGETIGGYTMASIVTPPSPPDAGIEVRPATPDDLPAVAELLASSNRVRPFGQDLPVEALRRRFREWPGLALSDLRLAFRGRRLAGCAAPWDPSPVRQTRISSWGLAASWRAWQGARRAAAGLGPLPRAGEHLRLGYLTMLDVPGEDPAVLAALAAEAWPWSQARGLHGVAAMLPRGSPMGSLLPRGTPRTEVDVHAIALPGVRKSRLSGHPGLEMAIS